MIVQGHNPTPTKPAHHHPSPHPAGHRPPHPGSGHGPTPEHKPTAHKPTAHKPPAHKPPGPKTAAVWEIEIDEPVIPRLGLKQGGHIH